VTTGQRVPGMIQVLTGLKAGDTVITAGQSKPMMGDGLPVAPIPAQGADAKQAESPGQEPPEPKQPEAG
jgi:membrane fusion protein (multidrug efflux system)